jgi:CBS domain-containing protein
MRCPDCGTENIEGDDSCAACSAPLVNALSAPAKGMEKRVLEGTASDINPKKAFFLKPSDTLASAIELMRKNNIGCVLAVENGRCEGLLADRDFVLGVAESQALSAPISQFMQKNPDCLAADAPVAEVFHRMAVSGHLHLPVALKDGSFGVLSARDLLRHLCK